MFRTDPPIFDRERHDRRSIRKRDHDYTSQGLYFVTFCTNERHPWFGKVVDGKALLNANGFIAYEHWHAIKEHYLHVEVREFTIMPDHIHGIVELKERPPERPVAPVNDQRPSGPMPGSLGAIVGSYRAGIVRDMNRVRRTPIRGLWQRGYHDVIIRDDRMLAHITSYIQRHPAMVLPR
jgi:REP element-mobilizing transposase RayT